MQHLTPPSGHPSPYQGRGVNNEFRSSKNMTMEHKAFIFDYDTFVKELADILIDAIETNENHQLIAFIENNLPYLKNSEEGESLDTSWKELIEVGDASEYGDFAITKYYNPADDIGLGYDWMQLDDLLLQELNVDVSPLLGTVFGSSENYFNPGKQGSYFQSLGRVKENFELLNSLSKDKLQSLDNVALLIKMLSDALASKKGLYITF
ncbi:MAG: hypothetical protein KI793_00395 [Rivularia sp. (in: Bacteria)]|nr:hypothetical protein [Rivularia sp. MS3]